MLDGWQDFFFMLGSAAAGLIGLLFVVASLTSGFDRAKALRAAGIYLTPTAAHFGVVLTLSGVALAPGLSASARAALAAVAIVAGLGAALRSCLGVRALGAGEDPPHWSDFWLYGALPALIYLGLGAAAAALGAGLAWSADALAGCAMLLLLSAIRNAWDLVTWMAPQGPSGGG